MLLNMYVSIGTTAIFSSSMMTVGAPALMLSTSNLKVQAMYLTTNDSLSSSRCQLHGWSHLKKKKCGKSLNLGFLHSSCVLAFGKCLFKKKSFGTQ